MVSPESLGELLFFVGFYISMAVCNYVFLGHIWLGQIDFQKDIRASVLVKGKYGQYGFSFNDLLLVLSTWFLSGLILDIHAKELESYINVLDTHQIVYYMKILVFFFKHPHHFNDAATLK